MMRIPAAIALGLVLASCAGEPPIQCDSDGSIIIPDGTPDRVASEWRSRNFDLATLRLNKLTGGAEYATPATLEKAKGCP